MAFGTLYWISIHTCSSLNMVRILKLKHKNVFLVAKQLGGKKAQQPRTRMPIVATTRIMLAAGTRMVLEARKTPQGRMNLKFKVLLIKKFIYGCPTLPLPSCPTLPLPSCPTLPLPSCHNSSGVNSIPLHPPVVLRVGLSIRGRHLPGGGCIGLWWLLNTALLWRWPLACLPAMTNW